MASATAPLKARTQIATTTCNGNIRETPRAASGVQVGRGLIRATLPLVLLGRCPPAQMCRRLCLFWVALATTFSACTTTPASCPSEPFLSGLFAGLNFSYPGLEDAAKALAAGDNETACAAIARYYVTAPTAQWLRPSNPTPTPSTKRTGGWADVIMADNYSFYGTQSLVPRFSGGGLNWSFCPGPTYDPQWMLALNRHGQLPILVEAWLGTGNPVYSRFFDNLVTDWIAYSGTAPATLNNRFACGMRPPDWLTLDTGIRLETPWPQAFFGAQAAGDFSTRTRLTMLASTLQSARYLRDHQSSTANWEATQLRAIAQTALAYPEATASPEWLSFSVSGMIGLLQTSIYPDGVSSEQTTGYDMVALGDFDSMLNLLRSANATFDPKFAALVEQMYTFIAYDVDYEGSISLNGDTDEKNVTDYLLAAARKFNRSDWAYVATRGADGAAPPTPGASSKMFPWAGQFIMRNSYKGAADALTWAWFDVGPFGSSGHAHRDKLHLSMRAFGAHLLVDSGRFTYVLRRQLLRLLPPNRESLPTRLSAAPPFLVLVTPVTSTALVSMFGSILFHRT